MHLISIINTNLETFISAASGTIAGGYLTVSFNKKSRREEKQEKFLAKFIEHNAEILKTLESNKTQILKVKKAMLEMTESFTKNIFYSNKLEKNQFSKHITFNYYHSLPIDDFLEFNYLNDFTKSFRKFTTEVLEIKYLGSFHNFSIKSQNMNLFNTTSRFIIPNLLSTSTILQTLDKKSILQLQYIIDVLLDTQISPKKLFSKYFKKDIKFIYLSNEINIKNYFYQKFLSIKMRKTIKVIRKNKNLASLKSTIEAFNKKSFLSTRYKCDLCLYTSEYKLTILNKTTEIKKCKTSNLDEKNLKIFFNELDIQVYQNFKALFDEIQELIELNYTLISTLESYELLITNLILK